jgi:hypothetical protein
MVERESVVFLGEGGGEEEKRKKRERGYFFNLMVATT